MAFFFFTTGSIHVQAEEQMPVNQNIVDTSKHVYTYEEMQGDLQELQKSYPDKLSVNVIGNSVDGRKIYNVILGNADAPNKIYVQAGIHGREWMNCMLLMKQIEYSLQVAPQLFNETTCLHIVPMLNPDGVSISQRGLDAIENLELRAFLSMVKGADKPARWKANGRGIDLNRQFPVGFNAHIDEPFYSSANFNGTAPLTEPEAIAVMNLFTNIPYKAAVCYHSYEGTVYWDLGQQGTIRDASFNLANLVHNVTGYRLGKASNLKGLEYDSMVYLFGVPAVVIETGRTACPLPYSQWPSVWNENKDLPIYLTML